MELPNVGSRCQYDGCGVLDFLPVVCDACRKQFCAVHGCATAHACDASLQKGVSVPAQQQAKTPVSVYTHPVRIGPKDVRPLPKRKLTADQQLALEAHRQSSVGVERVATRQAREPRVSSKVELMRLKAKSVGNASIDMDDRIYLRVKHKTKSIAVYEAMIIGNAAERFARQLGLSMLPGRVYRLGVAGANQPLPSNRTFGSMLGSEKGLGLYNGCTLELDCTQSD
ncbi:zinc finger, AN1-type domain [Coemansia sp. BCRC 34301]|nr:zinc finger, AN1-type domain [Coemansia sp. BCRC 34301]